MDEIKSLSFHIMLYRFFHGVTKYIVYGNTFLNFLFHHSLFIFSELEVVGFCLFLGLY